MIRNYFKAIAVTLSLCSSVHSNEKPVIKIGVVTPLSGSMAHIGKSFQNGATLALEELAKRDTRYRYEVVFEDNAFDSKKSALAAQKLISTDKVDAILSTWDACGLVIAPLADKAKVIHFGTAWTDKVLIGPYNFNMATPPTEQARQLGIELKKRKLTKLGMIHDVNNAAEEIRSAFNEVLPKFGVTITGEERFSAQERDFRTLFAKLQNAKTVPEVLYVGGFSPQLELVGKQLKQTAAWWTVSAYLDTVDKGCVARETKCWPALTTCECFDETQDKKVFEGCWYVAPAMPNEAYLENYKKRFGLQMIGSVALSYNTVMLVAEAYETTNTKKTPPGHETIVDTLRRMQTFKGLTSEIRNDGKGFFVVPAITKVIRDGKSMVMEN